MRYNTFQVHNSQIHMTLCISLSEVMLFFQEVLYEGVNMHRKGNICKVFIEVHNMFKSELINRISHFQ